MDILSSFLNNINSMTWVKNSLGQYVQLSDNYAEKIGIIGHTLVGKSDEDLFDNASAAKFKQTDLRAFNNKESIQSFEYMKLSENDKEARYWLVTKSYFEHDGEGFIGGIMTDCTSKCLEIMHTLANPTSVQIVAANTSAPQVVTNMKDDLTGLLNRKGFYVEIEKLTLSQKINQEAYLFSIDLNDLKRVNDTEGHEVGDVLLAQFAHVLKKNFRDGDLLARMSGDEYMVFVKEPVNPEEKIASIRKYIEQSGLNIKFACGWTHVDQSSTIEQMVKMADKSMYENKKIMKRLNIQPADKPKTTFE